MHGITFFGIDGTVASLWSRRAADRALRLVCALAVAMVAMFHVCTDASATPVDGVVIADASGSAPADSLAAIEKCHMCAVVSLPVMVADEQRIAVTHTIPSGVMLHVTPADLPANGPPPRT